MLKRLFLCLSVSIVLALSACSQADSIDAGGATFDGIAPNSSITLTGAEPFWGLEIEPEGDGKYSARFNHSEDIDGSEFIATRFAGNNGLGFSGTLDGKAVHVALTPGECSDGMSERTYPFTATLALGDEVLFGCAFTNE